MGLENRSRGTARQGPGPLDAWEIDEQVGELWVPAPRVGLRQRDSVRPTENFSVFGQNSTSSTVESPAAESVDEIAALIKTHAAAANLVRKCYVFEVCKDYVGVDAGQVVGRTLDLEKAYKNLAPSPAFRSFMVVAVWHLIKRRVVYHWLLAMLFGARNSVYSFARFGKALQLLCCVLFWLASSEYVDDFTWVGLRADAKALAREMLGW